MTTLTVKTLPEVKFEIQSIIHTINIYVCISKIYVDANYINLNHVTFDLKIVSKVTANINTHWSGCQI